MFAGQVLEIGDQVDAIEDQMLTLDEKQGALVLDDIDPRMLEPDDRPASRGSAEQLHVAAEAKVGIGERPVVDHLDRAAADRFEGAGQARALLGPGWIIDPADLERDPGHLLRNCRLGPGGEREPRRDVRGDRYLTNPLGGGIGRLDPGRTGSRWCPSGVLRGGGRNRRLGGGGSGSEWGRQGCLLNLGRHGRRGRWRRGGDCHGRRLGLRPEGRLAAVFDELRGGGGPG